MLHAVFATSLFVQNLSCEIESSWGLKDSSLRVDATHSEGTKAGQQGFFCPREQVA
ncbi:hypothetical protein EMIT0215P_50078 [Pseudomonas serboccidentalis]